MNDYDCNSTDLTTHLTNQYQQKRNPNYQQCKDENCTLAILLTKIFVAQNEVALSYHRVRGPYFLAVIFAAIIAIFGYNYYTK